MATLTFNYADGDDGQIWLKGTGAAGQLWSPVISGIPSGATINSVTMTFACGNTYSSPGRNSIYWGKSTSGTRIWNVTGSAGGTDYSVNLASYIKGNGTYNLYFYKTANSSSSQSNVYFTGVTITVDYTIPYSLCTAPTSVTISPTSVVPGGSATLSWSGAGAGTSNPITGYGICYCDGNPNGTYTPYIDVWTSNTSGNYTVTGSTTNNTVRYFKILTLGTVDEYKYGTLSSSYASLTCKCSATSAPTSVTISATNVAPGANVTLSWSGAGAGTNNAITGYHIYRATSASGTYSHTYSVTTTATSGSVIVTAPTTNGSSYYYKVYTIGTVSGYNSGASSYVALTCSFSAPSAPTSVTINGSSSVSMTGNDTATLAWSGGSSGTNNPMTGYKIYIDGSLFRTVGTDVSSLSITAFSAGNHTLTVRTAGTYSDSADSASVYCVVASDIIAPTSCLLDGTLSHDSVALYWSGAIEGINNAITGYEVQQCESIDGKTWGDWETLTTQPQETLNVSPPETYGNYYWYRVKACGEMCDSEWKYCTHTLRRDHEPIPEFTDSTLTVRETSVKAIHMTELQDAISMLLDFYGLERQNMTDIVPGKTGLNAWTTHVNEIRNAIDFLTTYHDDWLEIQVNCPRADVIQQLRDIETYVEKPKCVLGVGKLGAMVTE